MKIITALFAIGLIAGCNAALAAEAGDASGSDPVNLFGGPLDIAAAGPRIIVSGEDLANPFNEAHPMEQGLYASLYYNHYHGLFYNVNAPAPQEMPSAFDAKGRPLWFDGPRGETSLQMLVAELFVREQFDDLNHLFDDWNNPSDRMADGRWKLAIFQIAMQYEFSNSHAWDTSYQLVRRWREKSPESRAAALTEALYWFDYAWSARGHGYARSVTPEGWKLFRERLQKAEAVLLESKPYASSSPLWGRIYIDVGNGLVWPKERLFEEFNEEIKKERDFNPIYSSMVVFLVPKWGGS